jgi:Xaa-Pro dipeptidase
MMPLGEAFYRHKVAEIQARLGPERLDGLLLLDMPNVVYASGFVHIPSERPLGLYIPARGNPVLFVPLLEQENAAETWIGDIRTYFEYPGEEYPVVWMVRESGAARLGIDNLSASLARLLDEHVTVTPLVEHMRWIKEPEEIALIERAASYAVLFGICARSYRRRCTTRHRVDILRACMAATLDHMRRDLARYMAGVGLSDGTSTAARAQRCHGNLANASRSQGTR